MNLNEILIEVGELPGTNQRTNLDLKRFVNRAVRSISNRKNWTFLKSIRPYVILSGQTGVSMGPDFKCLSGEESPISVTYNAGNQTFRLPVRVLSREEVERQLYWPWIGQFLNQPVPGGYVPIRVVFMERNADGHESGEWYLKIPPQFYVQANSPYNVSAYYHPRPLILGTDSNPVTNDPDLADAVVNYAKSLMYAAVDPTSKQAAACMAMFEDHFTEADYTDGFVQYSGRSLRM